MSFLTAAMLASMRMKLCAAFAGGQKLCPRQFGGNLPLHLHFRRGVFFFFFFLRQLPAAGGRS